ncbi:MAG: UbiX family flavin prenyltransferase [Acidobacteria bacterium]|nr:UbiX family flavin prenyltransferase [Acidobacteriota bacterium]
MSPEPASQTRSSQRPRMVVAITGASGTLFGVEMLNALRRLDVESHLVVSKAGSMTRAYETDLSAEDLRDLADHSYAYTDIAAPIASGSFRTMGMVVVPCSVRTMSDIAHGTTSCLTSRAADVMLKERRRLVLMVRETPLHTGHLRSMLTLSEMGAIIAPPVPAFYTRPETLDDLVRHTVGRVLDLFDLDTSDFPRWGADVDSWPVEALGDHELA